MQTRKLNFILVIIVAASLSLGSLGIQNSLAQEALPPARPAGPVIRQPGDTLAGNPYQPVWDAAGRWVVPAAESGQRIAGIEREAASGGPDEYGYTWSSEVSEAWVSAEGGNDLPLSWANSSSAPIELGFPFNYYENTYTQVTVSLFGFLTFDTNNLFTPQAQIPSAETPDNVIAPHWAPYDQVAGFIRTLQGGTAPNRYLVVEWNRLQMDTWDPAHLDEFTFEAILYENGDMVFQYATMSIQGGFGCMSSGIEDATGLDGLAISDFCQAVAGEHDVRITRPAAAARVSLAPRDQGGFTRAGGRNVFEVALRNTGELGADTYELSLVQAGAGWTVNLLAADGSTPLADTDSDGSVDSGEVAQDAAATIFVEVLAPHIVNVGDACQLTLQAASSLDPARVQSSQVNVVIPAPFAQTYHDAADEAQSVLLAKPDRQLLRKTAPDQTEPRNGALVEAPNGNQVSIWQKVRCLDANCAVSFGELELAILGRDGSIVRAATRLTDFTGSTQSRYDSAPVIAVAPNGRIGVIWQRLLYNENGQPNYNLYFASLDSAGNISGAITNLTQNTTWGFETPFYYYGRIAATGDNRFVLAWYASSFTASGSLRDIYFDIRDAQGAPVAAGKITSDTPGSDQGYSSPAVTALANNRVLVAYAGRSGATNSTHYLVLDSSGNTIQPAAAIDAASYGLDAAQFSDGRIILTWSNWMIQGLIQYVILDGNTNTVLSGPVGLDNPASATGDDLVSVTTDRAGRAILTWTDSNSGYRRNLYYALIASDGSEVTAPMIFHTAAVQEDGSRSLTTSSEGAGNTSYTFEPSSPQHDAFVRLPGLVVARPAGIARIPIYFGNAGAAAASGISVRVALGASLGYVSSNLGITPVLGSLNTWTWTVPGELAFLGYGEFDLLVSLPDAPYGTRFPVTVSVTSAGTDGIPANNTLQVEVMAAHLLTLPAVLNAP